jgi:hypothetical protein
MNANEVTNQCSVDLERPVWIRIPKAIQLFGISRSKLYMLAGSGKIRSVSLKEPGQTKATRLFNADSINSYIESFLPTGKEGAS